MHRIPLTHPPFPLCPQELYIYALAKPLTAVLQYNNIHTCNQVLKEDN